MAVKSKWIQKATKKMEQKGTVGSFSAKAKRKGMSTKAYANWVMRNSKNPKLRKQANFARNVSK
jgi:hypothetical protein